MLTRYHRWIYENHKIEAVEVLREWVIQETEFQTKALCATSHMESGLVVSLKQWKYPKNGSTLKKSIVLQMSW